MPSKVSEAGSGTGCNDPSKLKVPPPAELTVMTKVNAYGVVEMSAPAVPERPIKLEAEDSVLSGVPVPKMVLVKSTALSRLTEDPGSLSLIESWVSHCVSPVGESNPVSDSSIVNNPGVLVERSVDPRSICGRVVDIPPSMLTVKVPKEPL